VTKEREKKTLFATKIFKKFIFAAEIFIDHEQLILNFGLMGIDTISIIKL